MDKFCRDVLDSFFRSVSRKKSIYVWFLFALCAGIIIGLILAFSDGDLGAFLSVANKNYVSYLNGTAELSAIFVNMIGNVIFSLLVCLILSFSVCTVWVSLLYISYQSCVMVLTIASVILKYGVIGVINSLLLILPFNLVLILCLGLQIANMYSFCAYNKTSNTSRFSLRYDRQIFTRLLILFLVQLVVCVILSYFVPFLLKSLIIVSY